MAIDGAEADLESRAPKRWRATYFLGRNAPAVVTMWFCIQGGPIWKDFHAVI
jgi:hypothetical protein